jgi:hypothetical protein
LKDESSAPEKAACAQERLARTTQASSECAVQEESTEAEPLATS